MSQTTSTGLNERPLKHMMMYPEEKMLNVCLKEALKMNKRVIANKDTMDTFEAPVSLLELTDKVLKCSITIYKIYTLMIWILAAPSIREYFSKGETPRIYELWISILAAGFDSHICGLKPDYSKYGKNEDVQQLASTTQFTLRMIHEYCLL
jgi:hypothetical protein